MTTLKASNEDIKKTIIFQNLVQTVCEDLMEIKMHLCNERPFEAGFQLGRLYNGLTTYIIAEIEDDENQEC